MCQNGPLYSEEYVVGDQGMISRAMHTRLREDYRAVMAAVFMDIPIDHLVSLHKPNCDAHNRKSLAIRYRYF